MADGVSHLIRKGYLERLAPGKYNTTRMLNQAVGSYKPGQDQLDAPVQESRKDPAKIKKNTEPGPEVDLTRFETFIERLERAVEKLETTAQKLQDHKEIQDALDVMEKALAKRKQR